MTAKHHQRFELALRSEQPFEQLYELAVSLRDSGTSQFDLYLIFEYFFIQVRNSESNNDVIYDAIADNMDLIWGYCSESHILFKTSIDEDELMRYRQAAEQAGDGNAE